MKKEEICENCQEWQAWQDENLSGCGWIRNSNVSQCAYYQAALAETEAE